MWSFLEMGDYGSDANQDLFEMSNWWDCPYQVDYDVIVISDDEEDVANISEDKKEDPKDQDLDYDYTSEEEDPKDKDFKPTGF